MSTEEKINFYNENGYVVLKNAIPIELINNYEKLWLDHHSKDGVIVNHNGWEKSSPYLDYNEILDILCHQNIFDILNEINSELTLHLSFTSWVSTRKAWHQDFTKNDKTGAQNYVGAWVALDRVDLNSGPFQFIPGSHKWEIDFGSLYAENSEQKPDVFLHQETIKRQSPGFSFIGEKGDVILWHGHTVHRGSIPENDNLLRKSLIGHYGVMASNSKKYKSGRFLNDSRAETNLYN